MNVATPGSAEYGHDLPGTGMCVMSYLWYVRVRCGRPTSTFPHLGPVEMAVFLISQNRGFLFASCCINSLLVRSSYPSNRGAQASSFHWCVAYNDSKLHRTRTSTPAPLLHGPERLRNTHARVGLLAGRLAEQPANWRRARASHPCDASCTHAHCSGRRLLVRAETLSQTQNVQAPNRHLE